MFKCTGICSKCGRCQNGGMISGANRRKTKMNDLPKGFLMDENLEGYGVAFDVGTTTIVGILFDFKEESIVEAVAKTNPQNVHGLDVISRITFTMSGDENLDWMRRAVLTCLNEIIDELCEVAAIENARIKNVVICGNTTMSHIIGGFSPKGLAFAPFEPAYEGWIICSGTESGLRIDPKGEVKVLPNIAGHVGGDITAGIIATNLWNLRGVTLFIDIGTNGEMVVCKDGNLYTCSTAAGPAFEGAAISQGMRASAGAIEKILISDDEVLFETVDNLPPVGICGSGIIDAIAEMLKVGIVDSTGRIVDRDHYLETNPGAKIADRIVDCEEGRSFVLVWKTGCDDIRITQRDIREVQLAKGAVCAGIEILLEELDTTVKNIDRVIIGGAFGNYIDKGNAVAIGLLPKVDISTIEAGGNTAGIGALMAMCWPDIDDRLENQLKEVVHVELSNSDKFQEKYIGAMSF